MLRRRFAAVRILAAVLVGGLAASAVLVGQVRTAEPTVQPGRWDPPRTAWGHPDLQGMWTSNGMAGVPFERPKELAGRASFTEEEFAKRRADAERLGRDEKQDREGQVGNEQGPTHWYENWTGRQSRRTSLIIDPPDGQFPPFTPAGEKITVTLGTFAPGPWNGPEDFNSWDRCITRGLPSAMVPTAYNNAFQIFQTRNEIVVLHELLHIVRVIPIDGRPHLGPSIRQWEGDPRGHWEGNTLVVDVTNFSDKTKGTLPPNGFAEGFLSGGGLYTGTGATMHLVERWTPTARDTLQYEATVDDRAVYAKPWTIALDLRRDSKYAMYEYACHEGNHAIENTLKGSRAGEKEAR